jgi:hypothetical protein
MLFSGTINKIFGRAPTPVPTARESALEKKLADLKRQRDGLNLWLKVEAGCPADRERLEVLNTEIAACEEKIFVESVHR